jgi:hypothetical protein
VESRKVEDLNLSIIRSIEAEPFIDKAEFESVDMSESVGEGSLVGGGGHLERISVSGQLDGSGLGSTVELDPRVSSILSNLQNNGELHVHFHFGNK